jgi:hypothetical protein
VSETAPQLPTDIEVLQARLATALAERDAAIVERDQVLSQNERLRHLLHQLQRAQFGRRSEKLDPDQLNLAFEDIEQAIAATEADDDKKDLAGGARARREAPRQSRRASQPSAARARDDRARRPPIAPAAGGSVPPQGRLSLAMAQKNPFLTRPRPGSSTGVMGLIDRDFARGRDELAQTKIDGFELGGRRPSPRSAARLRSAVRFTPLIH